MGKKTGRNARVAKKKKVKLARASTNRSPSGGNAAGKKLLQNKTTKRRDGDLTQEGAAKQRSALLKRQARERMVLKHHLRELEDRKSKIVRGQNARLERRELAKYMRQLQEEQVSKHTKERQDADEALRLAQGGAASGATLPSRGRRRANLSAAAPAEVDDADWEDDDAVAAVRDPKSVADLKQLFANLL